MIVNSHDLCNITFTYEMIVNSHAIMTSISSLCRGKAYDSDNLSSEHFINAKQSVILPLCIFSLLCLFMVICQTR